MLAEPRFFGASDFPLYGVIHAPQSDTLRRSSVLLVPPGAQDYMASHWAYRRLAQSLAREGYYVLRFDYHGTGDSAGDTVSLATCRNDVTTAAEELRDTSGAPDLVVVGRRLGAALISHVDATAAVLWDPICSGRSYVNELRARDARREWWARSPAPLTADELIGFSHPAAFEAELQALTLRAPSCQALLVVCEEKNEELNAFLSATKHALFEQVTEEGAARHDEPILPQRAISRITAFVAQVAE